MYHFTVSETVIKKLEFFLIYKSYSRSKFHDMGINEGHQQIVSVNYLFERLKLLQFSEENFHLALS